MREHLEKLAAHLESLDSESGDAKAIRWALAEIDSLEEQLADCRERCAGLEPD